MTNNSYPTLYGQIPNNDLDGYPLLFGQFEKQNNDSDRCPLVFGHNENPTYTCIWQIIHTQHYMDKFPIMI